MPSFTIGDLAKKINAQLHGDPDCRIDRAEPLATAQPGAVTFLASPKYRRYLPQTQASAVILSEEHLKECPVNALVVPHPELAFAETLTYLYPPSPHPAGVHATAVIGQSCRIDPSVSIGPHCVLEEGVVIGARTVIGAGVTIGANARVGQDCLIYSRVSLYPQVKLGDRVIVHSGAVIGADGFGLTHDGRRWVKIPQVGSVIVGDDVEIGANTTIDRGALQDTVIGKGVKLDNLIMVAHNVKIGDHTAIAGCTGIAGSTEIGKHCIIGGAGSISGHLKIADHVMLTGTAVVGKDITEPGIYSSGVGVEKNSLWRRNMVRFHQLDDMAKRLRRLEQSYDNITRTADNTSE